MPGEVDRMAWKGMVPWHGLGKEWTNTPTIEQVWEDAFGWEVELWDGFRQKMAEGSPMIPSRYRSVCRSDNGYELGRAGKNWAPMSNRGLLELFREPYEKGEVEFETAGTLRQGRLVWILARIKMDPVEIVPGDPINRYFLASNGHGLDRGLELGDVDIRVVCANTEEAARTDERSRLVRLYHSRGIEENAKLLMESMDFARREFRADMEVYQQLAKSSINEESFRAYVKMVFTKDTYKSVEEQAAAEVLAEKHMDEVLPLMEKGIGSDIPGVRGTWWGAYNSVTEYLNHTIGNKSSARLGSLWFGKNKNLSQRAIKKATELALT